MSYKSFDKNRSNPRDDLLDYSSHDKKYDDSELSVNSDYSDRDRKYDSDHDRKDDDSSHERIDYEKKYEKKNDDKRIDIPEHNPKYDQARNEVKKIKSIVIDNIDEIIKRGKRLEDLDDKAENMSVHAKIYRNSAKKLKKHFCVENYKLIAFITFVLAICATILGLVIYYGTQTT